MLLIFNYYSEETLKYYKKIKTKENKINFTCEKIEWNEEIIYYF